MSERSNEDIANALHGLTGGDDAGTEPHEAGSEAQHAARDRTEVGSSQPGGPASRPRPTPLPRPAPQPNPANAAPPRNTPTPPARPASPVQMQPGRVSRTAAPLPAAAPPRAGAAQPAAAGTATAANGAANDAETTDVQPVDEDDRVIVPAAPLSALGPRIHYRPAGRSVPLLKTLSFRRTAIPILLTSAGLMFVVAVLKYTVNPDSVLALLPTWVPLALVATAVIILGVAILNMIHVRQQLTAEKAAASAAGGATSAAGGAASARA